MIELKYEKGKKISFHWLVSWRSKVYEYSSMGNDVKETILEFPRKICLHKQENSKETSPSALLTMPKPLTVWITINCGKYERDGNTRPTNLPLEKSVCRSGSNS